MTFTFRAVKFGLLGIVVIIGIFLLTGCGSSNGNDSRARSNGDSLKIITIGPNLTETVFVLGMGKQVIGRDKYSTTPADAAKRPDLGYLRVITGEGLLKLRPNLIIASTDANPDALKAAESAGVEVLRINNRYDAAFLPEMVTAIANRLNKQNEAKTLIDAYNADMDTVARRLTQMKYKPTVLFLNARRAGEELFVHGLETGADYFITAAGGKNLATFSKIQPLSPEVFLQAKPDLLIVDDATLQYAGGFEQFIKHPLLENTPAVKLNRIYIAQTTDMFGLGPRSAKVTLELQKALSAIAPPKNSTTIPPQNTP